ncbi:MAG: c-type cytochrome [Acidimicrobiales bacterium]
MEFRDSKTEIYRRPGLRAVWVPLVLVAAAASSVFPAATRAAATEGSAAAPVDVRQVFLADCGVCHGSDGRGNSQGPSLVGFGPASVDYELSTGRMPLTPVGRANDKPGTPLQPLPGKALGDPDLVPQRHEPAYPPETIAALVSYVASLVGNEGPQIPRLGPGNLAEGGDLFRLECASCHAWAGDGGALVRREAPALHAATGTQIAEAIRVGPSQMPAFGAAAFTDEQVDSVVAYVRYLDHPEDRGGQPLWHLGPFTEGAMALVALGVLLLFTRWIGERG